MMGRNHVNAKAAKTAKEESFEKMLCALCDLCVQRDSFTSSLGERQRRVRIQIEGRDVPRTELSEPSGGDHRRVVRRQLKARKEGRNLATQTTFLQLRPQTAVRRDTARDANALRVISARRVEHAIDERCHDDALKGRADVRDLALG